MEVTFGSLFAGIGGIDLGLERAGMVSKWQVEIDDYGTRVLEKHWPNVHRERDICQCGKHNLERVDVIAGGFPCQDISYAGRGAGLDGERSGLFFEAVRLVCELQPRVVILENVAALLARGLDRVLGTLAEIGYDAEWHCIPAAAVGAPHIRDRVFIHAYRHSQSGSPLNAETPRVPDGVPSLLADPKSDGRHEVIENGGGCGAGVGEGEEQGFRHGGGVTSLLSHAGSTGAGNKARETGGQRRQPAETPEPAGLRQGDGQIGTNGVESGSAIVSDTHGHYVQGKQSGGVNAERRQGPDQRQAGSLHAGERGIRKIEPRVGRGDDGIPDWLDLSRGLNFWEDGKWDTVPRVTDKNVSRANRLRGLGNAVVPQVAEVVGRIVMERLGETDAT